LDKKKQLDDEYEKELKLLTLKYDKLAQPIYEEVVFLIYYHSKNKLFMEECSKKKN